MYVRPDQIGDEITAMLGEVHEAYGWFGLKPRFAFATRPDDALGDQAIWDRAEGLIREALDRAGVTYTHKPKDGTFYAPKIDIYIDDALGREWQMATIQADLMMVPERFDLHYIDENGEPQRPICIHRAILGSLERFIGILVEHFAGAFPLWVAPVQAVIIPIADRHTDAAEDLATVMRSRGLRVEVDGSDNRMQNKIRLAQGQKVPVHGGAGRPGDRGQDGVPAHPVRGAAAGRGMGVVRRPARRGVTVARQRLRARLRAGV